MAAFAATALTGGLSFASSTPALAAAKNYDCSKPGNANKAACKGAANAAAKAVATKPAAASAKTPAAKAAATAPKPISTKVSSTTTTKTVTQKNYDCSKPGNKNKAVCKSAATTPSKPVATQTTVATTTRHYDCSKAGNKNKRECQVSTATNATASKPVAAPKPTLTQRLKNAMGGSPTPAAPAAKPAPAPRKAGTSEAVENHNPAGAIAQCKDGFYSHAKGRTGACSRHGGVGKWM
jgi:large subunit ribosomal protein L22e/Meckel syndrome type 1 protein